MAYKNDYKAVTGLRRIFIAVQTEDSKDGVSYGEVHEIDTPKTFGVAPEASIEKAYAGDRIVETAQSRGGMQFNMEFHSLPEELKAELVGEEKRENGLTYENSRQTSPYVGVIGEFTKEGGVSYFVGLPKAIVTPASIEGSTKEDGVEFGTLAFEGEAMERIFDGERKISALSSDMDYDFSVLTAEVFKDSTVSA